MTHMNFDEIHKIPEPNCTVLFFGIFQGECSKNLLFLFTVVIPSSFIMLLFNFDYNMPVDFVFVFTAFFFIAINNNVFDKFT